VNAALQLDEDDWLALALASGVGPVRYGQLMRGEAAADEAQAWLSMARAQCRSRQLQRLKSSWQRAGCDWITPVATGWPPQLTALADPPAALFLQGDVTLLTRPQIAVVGTRRMSRRGADDAAWLTRALVSHDLAVTSGLALGIDACAHRQALAAGGTTIAVLGGGLAHAGPRRNRTLAERIAEQGLLVSEQPPDTAPEPWHFPVRNRLISGLSLGVVVIEAAARSGSLITARLAGEQGREVFAVPGPARDPGAAGCLRLLREGAHLVTEVDDILAQLPLTTRLQLRPPPSESCPQGADPGVSDRDQQDPVLRQLDTVPVEFDRLLLLTGLDAAQLNARLVTL